MSAPRKILIVGPSWIGDMVMAQSLYRYLNASSATPELHVIAPGWSLPVLARMPEVARAIELPVAHRELKLATRYALGRRLRVEGYAQALVLPRSAKAALVPFFARIPRRTGFRGEWRYGLLNDIRPLGADLDQTVKRFVALGRERGTTLSEIDLPQPRLTIDALNRERLWQRFDLPRDRPLAALLPGAEYGPAKRWPAERFGELAGRLAAAGAGALILGSAKERALGDEIKTAARAAAVWNLSGETELTDAIDLLSAVRVAVSNDSGLLHVAAAAGTHVIALYGSSSPKFTPPLTGAKTVIYRGVECSPCFARVCPLGHLRCLREITVDAVAEIARARLEQPPAGAARAS